MLLPPAIQTRMRKKKGKHLPRRTHHPARNIDRVAKEAEPRLQVADHAGDGGAAVQADPDLDVAQIRQVRVHRGLLRDADRLGGEEGHPPCKVLASWRVLEVSGHHVCVTDLRGRQRMPRLRGPSGSEGASQHTPSRP